MPERVFPLPGVTKRSLKISGVDSVLNNNHTYWRFCPICAHTGQFVTNSAGRELTNPDACGSSTFITQIAPADALLLWKRSGFRVSRFSTEAQLIL